MLCPPPRCTQAVQALQGGSAMWGLCLQPQHGAEPPLAPMPCPAFLLSNCWVIKRQPEKQTSENQTDIQKPQQRSRIPPGPQLMGGWGGGTGLHPQHTWGRAPRGCGGSGGPPQYPPVPPLNATSHPCQAWREAHGTRPPGPPPFPAPALLRRPIAPQGPPRAVLGSTSRYGVQGGGRGGQVWGAGGHGGGEGGCLGVWRGARGGDVGVMEVGFGVQVSRVNGGA